MTKTNWFPLLQVFVVSLIAFALHKLCFYLLGWNDREMQFHHSLTVLYGFFMSCSAAIVLTLLLIRKKNLDHVGYAFLMLTTIKIVAAYFVVRPILRATSDIAPFEKGNFFVIFSIFLTLETVITIRILNKP